GIFTQPTIFGASGGRLQGAGEAGDEAVLPLNDKTLGAIGKGIAATMGGGNGEIHIHVETLVADNMASIDRLNQRLQQGAMKSRNMLGQR
ncbi:phage tail tape measure protein, partial [Listeria sp. FSL L7-1435]|nr:phage tail tape measure protein [Listeria cossartiae subsp. cossartiae]